MVRILTQRRMIMITPTKAMMKRKERSLSPMLSGSWLRMVMSTRGVSEYLKVWVWVNYFCFGWSEECQIFVWINIHEYINNEIFYLYLYFPTWIRCVTLWVPDLEAAALAPVKADHALGEGHQAAGLNPSTSWKRKHKSLSVTYRYLKISLLNSRASTQVHH